MAQTLRLKRSSVAGRVPTTATLQTGEIAINTADGLVYIRKDDNTIIPLIGVNTAAVTGSVVLLGSITATSFTGSFSGSFVGPIVGTLSTSASNGAGIATFTFDGSQNVKVALDTGSAHFVNGVTALINSTVPAITAVDTTGPGGIDLSYNSATGQISGSLVHSAVTIGGTSISLGQSANMFGTVIITDLNATGSVSGSFTGTLTGTASWANNATTASYAQAATSASFASSAFSSSYAVTASYANVAAISVTSSYVASTALATTASYANFAALAETANTANFATNATSATFASTASYVLQAVSASYTSYANSALSASYATTSSYALTSISATNAISASYAATASSANDFVVRGDQSVGGNLVVSGKVTAQEFHTTFVSASIVYSSGSTKFGDTIDDIHQITGSVRITGSLTAPDITINRWGSVSASLASINTSAAANTLQTVTDNGNVTTNSIGISSSLYVSQSVFSKGEDVLDFAIAVAIALG